MMDSITKWLMEGPPWLRYAVELQLLDMRPDPASAIADSNIAGILKRLKGGVVGIPAFKTQRITCEQAGNAYWDLFFLADIGFQIKELQLEAQVEELLNIQAPDGTFLTERVMNRDYFCVSAIFMSSLARMGCHDDPRMKKYLNAVLNSQIEGNGWHCREGYGSEYSSIAESSCPMDNLNVLLLLASYEEYRRDPRFNGALDLLLRHWQRRDETPIIDGFGVGNRFRSLKYPAVLYGILRVLDVLSLYPYAIKTDSFKSMLSFVQQKAIDGKYFAGSAPDAYFEFDFGQTKEPSRWITFLVKRVEKRVKNLS